MFSLCTEFRDENSIILTGFPKKIFKLPGVGVGSVLCILRMFQPYKICLITVN